MEKSAEKTSSRQLGTHSKAFKSFKYWAAYEAIGGNFFRVSSVIAVTALRFFKTNDLRIVLASNWLHTCCIYFLFFGCFSLRKRKGSLAKRHISLMTAELQKTRPGVSEEAWDQIALELNDQFYRIGIWRSHYFFYDGNDCQSLFREICLVPYHKKEASELSANSADLEKGSSVEEDTDLAQGSANKQCAIEYEDSVRSFFNYTITQEPLQISSEFAVLPKELYSKLYFNIRFLISGRFFFLTIAYMASAFNCIRRYLPLWLSVMLCIAAGSMATYVNYLTYSNVKFYKLSVPERIRIMTDVMRTKPEACDVETWETLAKSANQWLHARGTWKKSDEFIFDGEEYKQLCRQIQEDFYETRYIELDSLVQEVNTALERA